jgi:hypothetical protein
MANCNQSMQSVAKRRVTQLPIKRLPIFRISGTLSVVGNDAIIAVSCKTRPLWFDGRFLAAPDVQCEQNYFLQGQSALGRAAGFGVVHGLTVDQGAGGGGADSAETIVVRAGDGITPSGELVMLSQDLTIRISDLPDAQKLDELFGLAEVPKQPARARTGIYVLALRPVQFTANPIATYPADLQSPRIAQDGDVVEATAVCLVPYPNPVDNFDMPLQQAALAHEIFVLGNSPVLPDSLLPLVMVSLDRNQIQWIDTYLVRRDSSPQGNSISLGLANVAMQQAYLMQYHARLHDAVASAAGTGFAASEHFQALPPAGAVPLTCISVSKLTQRFFPPQMNVRLRVLPSDEIPALLQDSLSLPPIDLTLSASSYTNISVLVFIAVPRVSFSQFQDLGEVQLTPELPILRATLLLAPLSQVPLPSTDSSGGTTSPWLPAVAGANYGFYTRLRDEPKFADFSTMSDGT